MERPTIFANQVTPSKLEKWCVLVQVIERRSPKKKPNGPLYRNHVVTDTQGTKVSVMVYDKSVAFFSHTLEPYKRYYVSNATVNETPPNYRSLEYPYTWTLYRKNLVEPYPEPIPPPLPCTFPYERFSQFYRYADQERLICIKALVVHTLPVQESNPTSSYRDCVVINEEKIPMIMRVWNDIDFDTDINVYARYNVPTLIIAYGLKVTTQHGLSLRTKTSAYIMENPPLNDELSLKDWYSAHATEITKLVENRAYRNPAYLFHPPCAAEIQSLSFAITAIENVKAVWTKGTLTYLPGQERLWFEACEKCLTELNVDTDWKIMCSYCKEYTKVTVCSDISVFLSHGPTIVEATIKSPEIDKLLPFTGNELRLAALENKPLTRQVEAALENKHVICFLKYYERENRGIIQRRYPLVKIYTEAEVHEHEMAQQASALDQLISANPVHPDHIGSSSSISTILPENQLFTPTIKAVLEEVAKIPPHADAQIDEHVGAKRMLAFEEPGADQPTTLPTNQDPHALPTASATTSVPQPESTNPAETTPTKKAKTKEKKT